MKNNVYTIFDKVAQESGPLFECKNDAVAQRNFKDLIKRENLPPKDYILYLIGRFEHETMTMFCHDLIEVGLEEEIPDAIQGI